MYNTRYHPADDVLRPFQAARLKGQEPSVKNGSNFEEKTTPELCDDSDDDDVFESSHETDEDEHEVLEASPRAAGEPISRPLSPRRRRSSRNSKRCSAPNYDMRYGPKRYLSEKSLIPTT